MPTDLRCEYRKHAEVVGPGVVEVKCNSKHHGSGVVVIHRFDISGDEVVMTTFMYKKPTERQADADTATVRSA